jgi:hypothetical protein
MMKNVFILNILFKLSLIYSWLEYKISLLFGKIAKEDDFNKLVQYLTDKTPEQIQLHIRAIYTYEADKTIDYTKHYLKFMYDKRGDCDDHCALCEQLLPRLGYINVYRVNVLSDNGGHAICIATDPKTDRIYGFGNWRLVEFDHNSLEHVGEVVSNRMSGKLVLIMKYIENKLKDSFVR